MTLRPPLDAPRARSSSTSRTKSSDHLVYANKGLIGLGLEDGEGSSSKGRDPWWRRSGRRGMAIAGVQLPFVGGRWRSSPGQLKRFAIWTVVVLLGCLLLFRHLYELHIELALYPRSWIRSSIDTIPPLLGCFHSSRISSTSYNTTLLHSPRFTDPQAGLSLKRGQSCYDFASTIPRTVSEEQGRWLEGRSKWVHLYWRGDLRPLEERQKLLIESVLATQDESSKIILWTNRPPGTESSERPPVDWILSPLFQTYPDRLETRYVDKRVLAVGTPIAGHSLLDMADDQAWLDGDIVRILVLWALGGLWIDMDTIVVRDLTPLLEHEFVTQWDCYDKPYQPLNGAMMHFHRHSPYLCEMLHILATPPLPRPSSTDAGSLMYHKLWRRLVNEGIPPFKILPYCFTDGRSCRMDNRLPDPFEEDVVMDKGGTRKIELERKIGNVFAVHLHNQWAKTFPKNGWVRRLIVQRNKELLGQRESARRITKPL